MLAQVRGLDQGTRNTEDMQNMIRTAEGGLDTVSDSAQRIRELSVQAQNGVLTDGQRAMIQEEIGQLAQGIQAAVNGTEFNSMPLLDGSVEAANTASSPNGTGASVSINDMSDIARAMTAIAEDGSFDLDAIDGTITQVASERANLGALSNRMDYTISANSVSSLNLADSRSRIADADMAAEMMALEQDRVINESQVLLQRQEQDNVEENAQRVLSTGA
jgi:flagellin